MKQKMRVFSEKPLNAETPIQYLRSWITPNSVFFDRNQGEIPPKRISPDKWSLTITGEIAKPRVFTLEEIKRMPREIVANTLECSGNSRSLLENKASGNPWTIGGLGNAVWGGIWLRDILEKSGLTEKARHVAFEGLDKPTGSSGVKFIRSIPIEKALSSTLLAYEMNGEALPLKHGYPLRALALGWTGANCVKWLTRIMVLDRPYEGFYMDSVYRIFQKGQVPATGEVVTALRLKAVITQPLQGETLQAGPSVILGAAYAGEAEVERVEVSVDSGQTWTSADFIGPRERFSWRLWQYVWEAHPGQHTILARAISVDGHQQPLHAEWNFLGYGNNGVYEHAVKVTVT
ncbi:MAG: sulfite oxidase [Syntrophobacteraceae bacterium]